MPSRGAPPSGCRHLPPQAGEGFQADVSRCSVPGEAGEGFQADISRCSFPCEAGEGFQADISRCSFPCEAGEGAEGGWGQSWLENHKAPERNMLQSLIIQL